MFIRFLISCLYSVSTYLMNGFSFCQFRIGFFRFRNVLPKHIDNTTIDRVVPLLFNKNFAVQRWRKQQNTTDGQHKWHLFRYACYDVYIAVPHTHSGASQHAYTNTTHTQHKHAHMTLYRQTHCLSQSHTHIHTHIMTKMVTYIHIHIYMHIPGTVEHEKVWNHIITVKRWGFALCMHALTHFCFPMQILFCWACYIVSI